MRMLLNVKFPHEQFNKAVKDGSVGEKVRRILDDTKAGGGLLHRAKRTAMCDSSC